MKSGGLTLALYWDLQKQNQQFKHDYRQNREQYFTAFLSLVFIFLISVYFGPFDDIAHFGAISLKKIQEQFSFAASFLSVEAELTTASGSVTIGNDSGASGGKFIEFGAGGGTASTAFQPSAPYYATFYYQWYKTTKTDGSWSYWSDHGNNPPNTWFSHFLPDSNTGSFDPANELYSSNDYNNFKWQVSKMAEAKQEVAIASWFGPGTKEDTAFNNVINSFMARSDNPYPNLRWAMYYEDEGFADPSIATIVADLNHIKTKFAGSPYFLKVGGKPVVFVYGSAADEPGTMTQRWKDANTQLGNSFYIVLKLFAGYTSNPNQPNSWHQYAPAVRSGTHSPHSSFVSPGFWLNDGVSAERLPRNATEFENAVKTMVGANATWKMVQTWNEWGEGTSVEPGEKVRTVSGKDEPDPTSAPFKNLYVDILNRNLPSLEQGTGVGSSAPPPPPSAGGDVVIVAAGDMACGPDSGGAACREKATSDLIAGINPSFVLPLGDNQYEQGQLANYLGADPYCNSSPIRCYNGTWGRFKNITRPVVGNHEYLTSGASGHFDYFNGVGNQSGPAGDRNKGYYAYDAGTWRLYALNSNCSPAGGCGAGSPQETWLRQDLAANPRSCVLAYYHHPLHTSGTRGPESNVQALFNALYSARAEVILAGHEHNYERFAPQNVNGVADPLGIREFVSGAGGRNFTAFSHLQANSESRSDNTFGVLKLTLKSGSYDWQFVPIAGSTFTDSGSGNCR